MIGNDLENGETEADGKGRSIGKKGVPTTQSNNNIDFDVYEMCGDPCGKCIIFNQSFSNYCNQNQNVSNYPNLKPRYGTNHDRDRLHNLFCWLKFEVTIYEDNTKDEMEEILKDEALDKKNEEFKCLVVCILSHGQEGVIYTAEGGFIELHDILRRFNTSRCRLMENKPKIFIVQACRTERNLNYINPPRVPSENNEESTGINNHLVAINADQILYQSTSFGSSALRNTLWGSPFIQTFCEVYEKRAFETSFDNLALEINRRFGDTYSVMCAIEPHRLRKKLYFKPETQFNVITDKQRHLIRTVWNVTLISHSPKKYIEEIENQVERFMVLQDEINKRIWIDRGQNQTERMRFNHWEEKECYEYVKRYYDNVDFFLFNYGSKDDIPDGFKSFIEKNKPSFVIKNYNLFKHFDFLKLADALTFRQKESLKRIKQMDHIGFDPKRNAIYFFKISDRNTVHDITVDIEDCATFVRMFFLLHRREFENKITCLVSFVVVPTTSLLKEVSKICSNCERYLLTEEEFQNFDETLCMKIRNTVSCANEKDRIYLKDEELKELKYNMKGIFSCMATQDGNLIPSLTENTSEQLKHVEIFLYPQQMEIANFNDKRVVLKGSYGSGKTIIGRILLKSLCFDSPNEPIYYINCGTSSDFTEDMENYVNKCIDENNNVVCLHNKNALGNILDEIKQNNSSAVKLHLIFEEVSLDESSEEDILSFCDALNQAPFHKTFCYIICQAMSTQRFFTNNGVCYKRSFSNQEKILKEKSDFEIKKLEIAARNTRNIDQLIEIGVKHLENAANKFAFKRFDNMFEFRKSTSFESFKEKEAQKRQVIQKNRIQMCYVENIPPEEHEEEHEEEQEEEQKQEHKQEDEELEEEHEEKIDKDPFSKRSFKPKELFSNLDASLKNVNILDNILHENREDHLKQSLISRFQYIKHLDLLHQIQGNKPKLYFPLDKKDDYDQFEEAYLLMQCFRDLLNEFFNNDENIILIHFENNTPETVSKAINLFEMIEERKVENVIFKNCLDVQGLEYKNVIIVLGIGEYHMRHYLIEAIARCKDKLAFLVVKESLKGADQDLIFKIIQEWEAKELITRFNQYSTEKLSEHKEQYESCLHVFPIQLSLHEMKKKTESIEEYLSHFEPIDNEEDSSSEEWHDIEAALKDDINPSYKLQEMIDELGKNLTSKYIPVVEEISQRVSKWKTFGRILGLNESFLNQLEREHQSYPERNNEIIRKFCTPLEPDQSWLFWRNYLEHFEDGVNVIKEMETTHIDLLAQTPDTSAHIIKTEKQVYIGHSYGSISNKSIQISKENSVIGVCVGSENFNCVDYQDFSEWVKTQQLYMDIYKMLKDQKSINFVEGSEKVCSILNTLKQYLDITNDPGFAVKGYNYVNHYSLFQKGMFAKDYLRDTYFCYLANDNIVLYLTESTKGPSHALYDSLRNIQIANSLHEDLQSNNIIQINVILHEQKDEIEDTSFCKQCIDNKLYTSKETFTDNLRFTTWYNDLLAIHKIQNKTIEHSPLSQSVIDIIETIKKDMITYEALESNIFPSFSYCYEDKIEELKKLIVTSPTQFQVLHSNEKHILLRGSYGCGKSVVLHRKLEQIINSVKPSDVTYLICNDQQSELHSYMKFIQSKFPKENILVCNSHDIVPPETTPKLSSILKHIINAWDNRVVVNVLIDEFNGSYFDETEVKEVCKMIELFKNSFIVIALQSMEEKVSELGKNIELTDLILGYQYDILTKDTSFVCYNLDYSLRCSLEINKFIEATAHILESCKVSYDYNSHIDTGNKLVIDKEQGREYDQTQPIVPAKVSYTYHQNESGHKVSCGHVNIYFVQQSWLIGREKSHVLFLSALKYILKNISDEKKYVISTYDKDLYNYTYYFLQGDSYKFTDKIPEFVHHETKFQLLLTEYAGIRGYEFANFIFLLPFGKRYLKYRMIECFSRTTTELHIIADNTRHGTDTIDKQLIKKWREIDCVKFFDCRFDKLSNTFNMYTNKFHVFSERNPFKNVTERKSYPFEESKYRWSCRSAVAKLRNDDHHYDDKSKALYCIMNADNAILFREFCSIHGSDMLTYRDCNKNDMLCIAARLNAGNILHMLINNYGFDVDSVNQYNDRK